jgi:adenine-specific DNA-methyltransferase
VTERKRPGGLARLASAANATNESGGEAETQAGKVRVIGWARVAKLAEPERAPHSGVAANRLDHLLKNGRLYADVKEFSLRGRACKQDDTCSEASCVDLTQVADRRRSLGIYYTPERVAEILTRWAIRERGETVLEPSFGGCALLEAAMVRLRDLGCPEPAGQLYGFDVDPQAFTHLTRVFGNGRENTNFHREDFLRAKLSGPERATTSVVCNPPFVSYHRMDGQQREEVRRWREQNRAGFPQTASLWAYFVVHALSFLAVGGRIAFVLPASILSADYSEPIRQRLKRDFKTLILVRVNEQVFAHSGAEERPVILLGEGYDPEKRSGGQVVVRAAESFEEFEGVVGEIRGEENTPASGLLGASAAEHLDALEAAGTVLRLGDLAKIRIGEVLGDTRFLAKAGDAWRRLGIGAANLVPIVTRTRQLLGLRLISDDIDNASGLVSVPRLLKPCGKRFAAPVVRYLETYSAEAKRSNCTFGKRDPWYAVSYDCSAKAFIGSLSHLGPRMVLNSAKVSCGNGLYKVNPRPGAGRWHDALAAATLSTITQISAERLARPRGAGALKLEPSDVARLQLPGTYRHIHAAIARKLIDAVDRLLRTARLADAQDMVDETLIVSPGILDRKALNELRVALAEARRRRLSRRQMTQRAEIVRKEGGGSRLETIAELSAAN